MLITESVPPSKVAVKVDFTEPFTSRNLNVFTLEPSGPSSSIVVWTWYGSNAYFMKVMSVFMNMDKMIGGHFESGLANLKAIAEK